MVDQAKFKSSLLLSLTVSAKHERFNGTQNHSQLNHKDNQMKNIEDLGVIMALLERLEKQRLPTLLAIKENVDNGQRLEEYDINFLKQIFADAQDILPRVQQYPEYLDLVGKLTVLYHEITEKALENEGPNANR